MRLPASHARVRSRFKARASGGRRWICAGRVWIALSVVVSIIVCTTGPLAGRADANEPPAGVTEDLAAGRAALDAGNLRQADTLARAAVAAATGAPDRLHAAELLTLVGDALHSASDDRAALAALQAARAVFDELGKPIGSAYVWSGIGAALIGLHRYPEALAAEQRAAELHRALHKRSQEAFDDHLMAQAYAALAEPDAALTAERSALTLYAALGDAAGEVLALPVIAALESARGRNREALATERSALPIARTVGPPQLVTVLLRMQAATLEALGQFAQERDVEHEAVARYAAQGATRDEGQTLFALGVLDDRLARYTDADRELTRAVAIARAENDFVALADRLESLGGVQGRLARYDAALRSQTQALQIDTRLQRNASRATVLNEIGLVYADRAQYPQALAAYRQAQDAMRSAPSALGRSDALNNIGNVYEAQGAHAKAAVTLDAARSAARSAHSRSAEALSDANAAIAYGSLGRYGIALERLRSAQAAYAALRDRRGESLVAANLGAVFAQLGRNRDALTALERSRALAAGIDDPRTQIAEFADLAVVEDRLGRYDAALADHQAALGLARSIADRRSEATELANIALLEDELGETAVARDFDTRALRIDRAIGDRRGAATALGGLSGVLRREGKFAASAQAASAELVVMRALADPTGEIAALSTLGAAQSSNGRCAAARASFAAAVTLAARIGDRPREAVALGARANAERCLMHWAAARTSALRSAALARQLANPGVYAAAQFTAAVAAANLGQRSAAIAAADEALRAIDDLRPGFAATPDRAAFFAATELESDFDAYAGYLATLDARAPHRGYGRRAFEVFDQRQIWSILDEFGHAAARRYAGVPDAVRAEDRAQTRALDAARAELARTRLASEPNPAQIRAAQRGVVLAMHAWTREQHTIRRRFPRYYALGHPHALAVADLQTRVLRPGELVLAYDVTPAGGLLWLVDRRRLTLVPLGSARRLTATVGAFRRALVDEAAAPVTPAGERAFRQRSYALYSKLVPVRVRAIVARATQLVVIAAGPLAQVPWEALVTRDPAGSGAAPHFLIDDTPVSYVPSTALLALTRATGGRQPARRPLVAFADPDVTRPAAPAAARGQAAFVAPLEMFASSANASPLYPALPGARREAEAVRTVLDAPRSDQHYGADASRATLLELNAAGTLRRFRYVMFATHAMIPPDAAALEPALVLAHPQQGGMLSLGDVLGLTLDADFVALSACDTGGGFHPAGEGISGLTRAFLYAGTPAISVTLWDVDDRVGPRLSPAFFAGMRAGLSPARALRRAKLALLHGRDAGLRRPYFWAPTVIFGDGD